ncbi:VOC family protein [Streptomyces resistomycificus]|uniref:Hydroxylase n=1 Tax=Streptomyces resistomycificus TaxID=67356 RepID=A0A0L8KTG9_9ACTN|nr:VOC family protein [Streptomyces resistomycificus]KOG29246.1 hydroxylase [Streptomyces resistomycificus]KUO01577.1 hydroxylase [Streptomyces resistomycificus]
MLTTRYVTGAPNWLDLGTPDIEGASSFYQALFGWQFQAGGPEVGGYGFFQLDGRTAAGGMQTTPDQGPPSWTVYFMTSDADATAKAAEQAHGSVLVQPMDVLDQGRMAILADRAGVSFGIWQPAANNGLDVVEEVGALYWLELYTPDLPAAAGFYNAVFGWETTALTFAGDTYTTVHPSGTESDAMFGAIVPLEDDPTQAPAGAWLPYFEVEDTDTVVGAAQERGGTVRMPATDLENVGRIAELADPYGARFAVITSTPPEA